MLTVEANERLTRVGPGTPCGELMRRHWVPIASWSQGEIVDRSKEKLGRTDIPIIFLRRQLEQQIRVVEDGGEPMNVFRDDHEILFGSGEPPSRQPANAPMGGTYRANYHKGFVVDDADRYGPAVGLIQELHRRIAEVKA